MDFSRWGHLAMSRYNWWTIGYLKGTTWEENSAVPTARVFLHTGGWPVGTAYLRSLWCQDSSTGERIQVWGARTRSKTIGREQKFERENGLQSSLLCESLDPKKSDNHKWKLLGFKSRVAVRPLHAMGRVVISPHSPTAHSLASASWGLGLILKG